MTGILYTFQWSILFYQEKIFGNTFLNIYSKFWHKSSTFPHWGLKELYTFNTQNRSWNRKCDSTTLGANITLWKNKQNPQTSKQTRKTKPSPKTNKKQTRRTKTPLQYSNFDYLISKTTELSVQILALASCSLNHSSASYLSSCITLDKVRYL